MDLKEVLRKHIAWLSGEGRERADLCNADLCGANLRGANLRSADLRGADMRGADLRNADLCNANLRGADLCGANLRGANLCDADLSDANLRGADLCCADLCDADLCGADLRGADLDYSSGIPLHCGGIGFKGDDRLMAQMIFHLTRGNWDGCSGGAQEAIEAIRSMAISDLFCEYRSDVKVL